MGTFWDSIEDDLTSFGGESGGDGGSAPPPKYEAPRAAGSIVSSSKRLAESPFGADYDTNADIVKQVQATINALGYQPALSVDGSYGPKTKAGVQWIQAARGLSADGVIGDQTLTALGIKHPAPTNWLKPVPQSPITGLVQAVVDNFPSFSEKYEGYTPYMYTDSKGLVTTGIGNLIDPIGSALSLPWRRPDGSLASQQEITDAWNTVKNAHPGTQSTASQGLTNLRLDAEGIAQLVHGKMAQNQHTLLSRYPGMPRAPADAQLALHSISWAWGSAFSNVWGDHGRQFDAAINQAVPDFLTAANIMQIASQHEESINPGIVPRDAANVQMFKNAAQVLAHGGNPNVLSFPLDYVAAIARWSWKKVAGVVTGVFVVVTGIAWAAKGKLN